jgi:hypothetical protein
MQNQPQNQVILYQSGEKFLEEVVINYGLENIIFMLKGGPFYYLQILIVQENKKRMRKIPKSIMQIISYYYSKIHRDKPLIKHLKESRLGPVWLF